MGTLATYYNDKTPSYLTLMQDQEIDYSTTSQDGIVGVRWTDRTGDQYYTRILRKSGNTWLQHILFRKLIGPEYDSDRAIGLIKPNKIMYRTEGTTNPLRSKVHRCAEPEHSRELY